MPDDYQSGHTSTDARLDQLVEMVFRLASGELDSRVTPSASRDSVDSVIIAVNGLADELQALHTGLRTGTTEQTATLVRSRLADELRSAVASGQLVLHYQPVVELGANAVIGVEALVRWQHPTQGVVPPVAFIGLAEETGLIVELGEWVLEHALAQFAAWRAGALGRRPFRLHVNTSPVQLRAPGFADAVHRLLQRHAVAASDLWLEITESEMIANDSPTEGALNELRAAGVGLAMDDFGTGYASIGYVRRLPVEMIKVDRSLISGLDVDPQQHGVATAILALIRAVGLDAVAEGVETEAESIALQRIGYHYAQGFHHGRPVPAADVTDRLFTAR